MASKRRELTREETDRLMEKIRPLSRREYEAIRVNIGCLNACRLMLEGLETRIRECIPYGWRDARMLESRWRTLFDKLLYTIPQDKLKIMKEELPYYELYIRMKGAAKYNNDESDWVALPRTVVMQLANYAADMNCPLCQKKDKQIKSCKLRKTLAASLPFNVETVNKGGGCPFSDYDLNRGELWGDEDVEI